MINTENFKMIPLRYDNIFIFDDKYVISQSNNINQLDLKTKPDYAAIAGLFFLGVIFLMIIGTSYVMIRDNLYPGMLSIILCMTIVMFRASILYRLSGKSILYKKDIREIYINEKRNCIFFKFKENKKRVKIRSMGLPLDINEKEQILQALYENNIIDREHISQIVSMKDGYLYVRDKNISFVDFKLYSQNIDAKKYIKGTYQLFALFSLTFLGSIVMTILWYKEAWTLIITVIMATVSIVCFIYYYKKFITRKSFSIKRDRIAGFSIDNDKQMLTLQYYTKNRQSKQKTLILSDSSVTFGSI
ncbi:MAG: hypothetical protein LBK96_00115 [Prevotellaceae bacterium]|jgi:hypothetical protein|nr:hypothetical protein [Prevotellaceae bacterium]